MATTGKILLTILLAVFLLLGMAAMGCDDDDDDDSAPLNPPEDDDDDDDFVPDDDDDVIDDDDDDDDASDDDDDDVSDDDDDDVADDDDDDVADDDDDDDVADDDDDDTSNVIADAGNDQDVLFADTVNLDASGSTGAVNYQWNQTAGIPVALTGGSTATPSFTAPGDIGFEGLTFEVTVDDGGGNQDSDTVNINAWPDLTNVWYVDVNAKTKSGDGTRATPYTTIAEALGVAAQYDYIYIAGGTYQISADMVVPDAFLLVGGFDVNGTDWRRDISGSPSIIQDTRTGTDCNAVSVTTTYTTDTLFDGLTIQGGDCSNSSAALYLDDADVKLMRNTFVSGQGAGTNIGVLIEGAGVNEIHENLFFSSGGATNYALAMHDTTSGIIYNNGLYSYNTGSTVAAAMYLDSTTQPTFLHNTFGAKQDGVSVDASAVRLGPNTNNSIIANSLVFTYTPGVDVTAACFVEEGASSTLFQLQNNLFAGCAVYYRDFVNGDLTFIMDVNDPLNIGGTIAVDNIEPGAPYDMTDVMVGEVGNSWDFHLVSGSEAIDNGAALPVTIDIDFEGDQRTDQYNLDIGCDEI